MILTTHDFWSHIARGTAGIVGVVLTELSRNAKISDSQIAFRVKDQVLRLDVPMDNFILVHVLQANQNVADEEFSFSLVKDPLIA